MKTAIIVGVFGQDGSYLYDYLTAQGYAVVGLGRDRIRSDVPISFLNIDILDEHNVNRLIEETNPSEIYYLPAYHHSAQDKIDNDSQLFRQSWAVHVDGLLNFCNAIHAQKLRTKLFYAASAHVFGLPSQEIQDETTPLNPICVYGITKTAGIQLCRYFRQKDVFASTGILYNHESPLRSNKFISMKIVETALAIKRGEKSKLVVGDLSARIDWGFAPDYVEAMHKVLSSEKSDDFIIATGKTHSVEDFVSEVFRQLELDWKKYIEVDASLIQKSPKRRLCGNIAKIMSQTQWKPKTDFKTMIALLIAGKK